MRLGSYLVTNHPTEVAADMEACQARGPTWDSARRQAAISTLDTERPFHAGDEVTRDLASFRHSARSVHVSHSRLLNGAATNLEVRITHLVWRCWHRLPNKCLRCPSEFSSPDRPRAAKRRMPSAMTSWGLPPGISGPPRSATLPAHQRSCLRRALGSRCR